MKRIGFLGPKGTFSQQAVGEYLKNRKEYMKCDYATIQDMITDVYRGSISEAVVPVENSLEGGSSINVTLDMLAFEVDLKIKFEIVLKIRQNLLIKKGTRLKDVKYLFSHPQALGQCRKYIRNNLPNVVERTVYSTAVAAKKVADSEHDYAAIGSYNLAEVYGLEIAENNIQDMDNNVTRFVVISKQDSDKTGCDKTSIVFSTENRPGSLYSILDIFNLWDINLTRIESRPAKNQLGKYIFFVDLQGHREEHDLRDALTMVKRKTSFYKFLGSYPAAKLWEITQ